MKVKVAQWSSHPRPERPPQSRPRSGHRLVLLATDDHGQMAAVEATAPDLDTTPHTRILKVRTGDLTFHAVPATWSYRATSGRHTYILTAATGDAPMWTVAFDQAGPAAYDDLDDAIAAVLDDALAAA